MNKNTFTKCKRSMKFLKHARVRKISLSREKTVKNNDYILYK